MHPFLTHVYTHTHTYISACRHCLSNTEFLNGNSTCVTHDSPTLCIFHGAEPIKGKHHIKLHQHQHKFINTTTYMEDQSSKLMSILVWKRTSVQRSKFKALHQQCKTWTSDCQTARNSRFPMKMNPILSNMTTFDEKMIVQLKFFTNINVKSLYSTRMVKHLTSSDSWTKYNMNLSCIANFAKSSPVITTRAICWNPRNSDIAREEYNRGYGRRGDLDCTEVRGTFNNCTVERLHG